MKNWRRLAIYLTAWLALGTAAYMLLVHPYDYSTRTVVFGKITELTPHQLTVQVKNTDAYYPSYPEVESYTFTYDKNTAITKQQFITGLSGEYLDATPPYNVPLRELHLGAAAYILYEPETGRANRIYIGDPDLPF